MSTEKAALRKAIRARYPGKSQRDAESARLCAVIAQSDLFRRANVVAGYVPMAREADIMPLLRLTLDLGKTLLLPRVEGARQMTMRQICDLSALIPGAYGIPEPPESAPILLPDAIDLLLTPLEGIAPDGTQTEMPFETKRGKIILTLDFVNSELPVMLFRLVPQTAAL